MKKLLCLFFTFLAFASHVHSNNLDWSRSPAILSGLNNNATEPEIAIDANGNVIAAWVENGMVNSSSQAVGGSWTANVIVSGTDASSLNLVADRNGNATAIWVEDGYIKASSKTLNGNWSNPTSLSNNNASFPTLCVDDEGNVIAAWVRKGNIEASTKLFESTWNTRLTVNSNAAAHPKIAIGGSGNSAKAVIVWEGTSKNVQGVYASAKLIRGPWTSPVLISDSSQNAAQPSVAVDTDGNAIALWYAYDVTGSIYSNVVVKTAERDTVSGNWSCISSLSQSGIRNPATLMARVAFDRIGNSIALWNNSYDDETFSLESAVKPVSGVWSLPVDLVKSNLYAYSADLSATAFGDVLGLYMFYNGASLNIQSIESDINGYLNDFWSVPITISQGANNAYPKIAATLTGNVLHAAAAWINYDGARNLVVASTGSKTLVLPPSNLSVTQSVNNFGVFNEYYNTLSWSASLDPNAVGYLVFRNGVFIEQVGVNTLTYVDNNRTQNGPVTYSVTAIDQQQTQSRTVSVDFP